MSNPTHNSEEQYCLNCNHTTTGKEKLCWNCGYEYGYTPVQVENIIKSRISSTLEELYAKRFMIVADQNTSIFVVKANDIKAIKETL